MRQKTKGAVIAGIMIAVFGFMVIQMKYAHEEKLIDLQNKKMENDRILFELQTQRLLAEVEAQKIKEKPKGLFGKHW